jgi:peroxiredoxin-like protein
MVQPTGNRYSTRMENEYTYTAGIKWIGEKKGVVTAETLPELHVATPPEFGGHEGQWSPEHLLVSSVASCIMTTFIAIAEASKFSFQSYESSAIGTIERVEKSYEFTRITVSVKLTVADEGSVSRAERLLQKAEQNCFISNSIKAEIDLVPEIAVG